MLTLFNEAGRGGIGGGDGFTLLTLLDANEEAVELLFGIVENFTHIV
jgi:hypothetical protein